MLLFFPRSSLRRSGLGLNSSAEVTTVQPDAALADAAKTEAGATPNPPHKNVVFSDADPGKY
eukprot:2138976-Heterocapsa_arctica.AAC.1